MNFVELYNNKDVTFFLVLVVRVVVTLRWIFRIVSVRALADARVAFRADVVVPMAVESVKLHAVFVVVVVVGLSSVPVQPIDLGGIGLHVDAFDLAVVQSDPHGLVVSKQRLRHGVDDLGFFRTVNAG